MGKSLVNQTFCFLFSKILNLKKLKFQRNLKVGVQIMLYFYSIAKMCYHMYFVSIHNFLVLFKAD